MGQPKSSNESESNLFDSISRVLGYIAVKDLPRAEDKVRVLAQLGYDNPGIAAICNTTSATVKTLKSAAKKKANQGAKRKAQ